MRLLRARDERGVVLPAGLLVGGICTVAVAAVSFVLTSHPTEEPVSQPVAATPTPARTAAPAPTLRPRPKPQIDRQATYVEVFNNSNVHGLAGRTAARAQDAGWNVVGSDNWYGTVEASTVYYPASLAAAAQALAQDLGIARVLPAVSPMKLDRLTVILTSDYAG